MFQLETENDIEAEFALAEAARLSGNEGRARVCARRAAGHAIRAFLTSKKVVLLKSASAYDCLTFLAHFTGANPEAQKIAGLLLLRVNEEFQLPVRKDLVAEARKLVQILEKETL